MEAAFTGFVQRKNSNNNKKSKLKKSEKCHDNELCIILLFNTLKWTVFSAIKVPFKTCVCCCEIVK